MATEGMQTTAGRLTVLQTADDAEWKEVLRQSAQHDFYHSPEYHALAERCGEGLARLVVYREQGFTIALPLLLRCVNEAPGMEHIEKDWKDATSVYGYAGPIASHVEIPGGLIERFHLVLAEWLNEMQVVAVFSRLHPLFAQKDLLRGLGSRLPAGQTVSIDLTEDSSEQLAHYRKDHRRDLTYLRKLGVTCIHDERGEYMEAFIEMYLQTMNRVGAEPGYFFNQTYFDGFSSQLGNSVHLFVCLLGGEAISAGLVTTACGIVQGHLSGGSPAYRKLASKKLLIDTVRQWATERGHHTFHLGGGVGSRQDSLFEFKAGFSSRRHEFATWRWVTNEAIYERLCAIKAQKNVALGVSHVSTEFFPAYRAATGSPMTPVPAAVVTDRDPMRALRPDQAAEWMEVLDRCVSYDFYHLPAYHDLEAKRGQAAARLFVFEEAGHTIAMPLLVRSIRDVPGLGGLADGSKDATSAYGYTGPISSHALVPPAIVQRFHAAFHQALHRKGVIAVFSRLHPLIPQFDLLSGLGETKQLGETVSLDLTLPLETQWQQFRENHRRSITKLHKLGFVCLEDTELKYRDQFADLYLETMRRVGAETDYLFDRDYFAELSQRLGDRHHLFVVLHDGAPVSGGIFIACCNILQFHLGGTKDEYLKQAPMKLIFDAVRRWGTERQLEHFHLGGGVGSQEDSLFHFKAGFSNRRHRFERWRWVVEPECYQTLCAAKDRWNASRGLVNAAPDYFPAYRAATVAIETLIES